MAAPVNRSLLGNGPEPRHDRRTSILAVLRRHFWIPLLCCSVASLGGAFIAAHQPRRYTAVALLQVNDPNLVQDILNQIGQPAQQHGGAKATTLNVSGLPVQATLNDIVTGIRNYRTAERAVEFLQLDPFLSPNQVLAATDVSVDPKTNLIDITAISPSPKYAANIANSVARGYVDLRLHADLAELAAARAKVAGIAAWRASAAIDGSGPVRAFLKPLTDEAAQLRLAETIGANSVMLARPASPPTKPSGTSVSLVGLIGALSGLAVGIGLMAIRDATDGRIGSMRDLTRALRAPLLAAVPATQRLRSRKRLSDLEPDEVEPFRMFLARLRSSTNAEDRQTVTLVSMPRSRNSSQTAWYLAATAAANGARTLLVDANDGQQVVYGSTDRHAPAAGGETTEIEVDAGVRIGVLVPQPQRPGAVVMPDAAAKLLAAADRYDFVVVDAPAVPDDPDGVSFVRGRRVVVLCDVRDTDLQTAERGRASLEELDASVIGFVAVGFPDHDG